MLKLGQYVPIQTLVCLYNSLFASFLNYGIFVWDLIYDIYLDQLFILHKKVLRCIAFQPFTALSTPLFHSLKLINVMHVQRRASNPIKISKNTNKLVLLFPCFEPNPICFKQTFTPGAQWNKQLNALSYLMSFSPSIHQASTPSSSFCGHLSRGPHIKLRSKGPRP